MRHTRIFARHERTSDVTSEVIAAGRAHTQSEGIDVAPKSADEEVPMRGYAVAHMKSVEVGPEIVTYLREIDATLAPFGGKFVIHGGETEVLEGTWAGALVVIGFPTVADARGWYASPAYRAILGLRLAHSVSDAIIVEGVDEAHVATDVLPR